MGGSRTHNRAWQIAERGKLLETSLLHSKGGAERAHTVVSQTMESVLQDHERDLLSRLFPKRRKQTFSVVGKLNENGTQMETMWVKEKGWNGQIRSTLLLRNLGATGRIYEMTSRDGTVEVVTEKDGSLIYQRHDHDDVDE